jgi:3-isopropylmalate dehydratase small subunit
MVNLETTVEQKLINFINENKKEFIELTSSEVEYFELEEVDKDIVNYLKNCFRNRFDYEGIVVYYDDVYNEIAVENMSMYN